MCVVLLPCGSTAFTTLSTRLKCVPAAGLLQPQPQTEEGKKALAAAPECAVDFEDLLRHFSERSLER